MWVDVVRYLLVFVVSSFDNEKKLYRAFNSVFDKVGRVASQNVLVELLMLKCVPILYYGSKCCHGSLNVSLIRLNLLFVDHL